jgi:hypothetical protein
VTDAVVTANNGDEIEAEAARRAIEEKTYGFWIGLTSDAIVFALLCAIFVAMAHGTADGPAGDTLFRLPRIFAQTVLLLEQRDVRLRRRCNRSRAKPARGALAGRDVFARIGLHFRGNRRTL